ncbi:DNA-formamidopyrimidine glycosylase family protein [Hamadaea tsunoensis]|uniref:DNA-formamidopyrimidine glycosylase family protein n=1 Tax=Hamadaea tsunoensis TaxID=53368 RepID=UPI00048688EB|nr:DNA-formamidopyrimidine glycosylase family protein [Hamadaea tsunoensis]
MPEGDTVWNTAQVLAKALTGQVLTGSEFRVPQLATADLTGKTVVESACRGKHLLLRVDEWTLHSHLRMDGSWKVYAPGARWTGGPGHTIRVVLRTRDVVAVGYHLHELSLVRTREEAKLTGFLGPDLCADDWDPAEARRRLAAQPDRQIAEALLDQRNLAGIGNLYKAEILFIRRVWPWTPVRDVPDLAALVGLARELLTANLGRWTQSTTGSLRRGETTYVYGRRNLPCRRCGTPIRSADQGERITYWCPTCQPAPAERG